jgi:hypothetical protein
MPSSCPVFWSDALRQALAGYDEPLLREVAGRLLRARSQWPAEELVRRCEAAVTSPPVIEKRLKALGAESKRLLALVGHSRQPRWPVGSLVELGVALGQPDGLEPILELLRAGLLYPVAGPGKHRCKDFGIWLAQAPADALQVFAHPTVTARALGEDLGMPDLGLKSAVGKGASASGLANQVQEADGLEWPLRLAVLWQQVKDCPLRRTQQRDFFKRDLDRLRADPVLGTPAADGPLALPDVALLAVALALAEGVLEERHGELHAGVLPASWDTGLPTALASLWAALPWLDSWDAQHGWRPGPRPGNPYPTAYLLGLLLLDRLREGVWASVETIAAWVIQRHPYWKTGDAPTGAMVHFLLGLAFQLRLVQVTRSSEGTWMVRLSPMGSWVLGTGKEPAVSTYSQTLLVQPNLEILAYRQGLTPDLAAKVGRFAVWKSLGAACTLQLRPETVYAALEMGETAETILNTLQERGTREIPPTVRQLVTTWASKRERISIYASATLFEFATPADLEDALARGLPALALSDRLAAVANESDVDFRHFRLTATRDYTLPPERCVMVEADGVTLTLDPTKADLLLESELVGFAEPVRKEDQTGLRQYRLTPASTAAGRAAGLTVTALEAWFHRRAGKTLPAAARLLMADVEGTAPELRRRLVLHLATEDLADGLEQWPGTRALFEERLGPRALVVAEEHAVLLQDRLGQLGINLALDELVVEGP